MTTTNNLGYIVPHAAFADVSAASINGLPISTTLVLGSGVLFDDNTVANVVRVLNRAPLTGVAATEQTLSLPPGTKIWDIEVINVSANTCDARFSIGTNVTPALYTTLASINSLASAKGPATAAAGTGPGYVTTQRETLQIKFTVASVAADAAAGSSVAILVRVSLSEFLN